jgi:hypothetical protein
VLYLKYLAGLLLITAIGAALAALAAPRVSIAALTVSIAALQCLAYAFITSARVLLGIAIARFMEARLIEPAVLPMLGRALDANDKLTSVAAEMAGEFKLHAAAITARVPLIGPLLRFLARRAPAWVIERKLSPRIVEAAGLCGGLGGMRGGAPEVSTREERAMGLLQILRERLRANSEEGVQWLLWIYAGLGVAEIAALLIFTR